MGPYQHQHIQYTQMFSYQLEGHTNAHYHSTELTTYMTLLARLN